MTNNTLSHVLRSINLSRGKTVRTVDNLEAVLVENHRTMETNPNGRFVGYYDYLILLYSGTKAGIILKCGSVDIHVYVYPQFREQHIVSRLTGEGFLRELWPDIESVTCANYFEYDRVKHLAALAGFELRN